MSNASRPREWPTQAALIRDEIAISAIHGLQALNPVVNPDPTKPMNNAELYIRIGQGMDALHKNLELSLAAGARVTPLVVKDDPRMEQGACRRITDHLKMREK